MQVHKRKLYEVEKEMQTKMDAGGGSKEGEAVPQPRYVQEYQMKVEAVPGHGNTVSAIQASHIQDEPRYGWGMVESEPAKRETVLTVNQHRDS